MTYQPINGDDVRDFLRNHGIHADRVSAYSDGVASKNFRAVANGGVDWTVRCDLRRPLEKVVEDRLFAEQASRKSIRVPSGPWIDGTIKEIATTARPTIQGTTIAQTGPSSLPDPGKIGHMLARLHQAQPPAIDRNFFYEGLLDPSHPLWSEFPKARLTHSANRHLVELIDFALGRLDRDAEKLRQSTTLPTCMIHGDFNPPNILIYGSDLTLIDWEKACRGYPVADVVQANYYFSAAYRPSGRDFSAPFLAAYTALYQIPRPVLEIWLSCFPAFIFLRDTVSAAIQKPGPVGEAQLATFRAYLENDSAPRFRHYIEHEAALR